MTFEHVGHVYAWDGERWLWNGKPLAIRLQVALSRAYLESLERRAHRLGVDKLVEESALLRDLARTDANLLEAALDFCSRLLRLNPRHKGARSVHTSILRKLGGLRCK